MSESSGADDRRSETGWGSGASDPSRRHDRSIPRSSARRGPAWILGREGGYANQLRRPEEARFTEDLDLRIEAAIEEATGLLAAGFAIDLGDDFGYEVVAAATPLQGPPGGGLRFVVVVRVAGSILVQFKVDVSAADVIVGHLEAHLSDPVVERLGFTQACYPVYPIAQHVAEKLHALTLPRDVENTRARDLVDLAWFAQKLSISLRCPDRRMRCDVRTPGDACLATSCTPAAAELAQAVRAMASRAGPL